MHYATVLDFHFSKKNVYLHNQNLISRWYISAQWPLLRRTDCACGWVRRQCLGWVRRQCLGLWGSTLPWLCLMTGQEADCVEGKASELLPSAGSHLGARVNEIRPAAVWLIRGLSFKRYEFISTVIWFPTSTYPWAVFSVHASSTPAGLQAISQEGTQSLCLPTNRYISWRTVVALN